MTSKTFALLLAGMLTSANVHAIRLGADGKIQRMVVNHNPATDQVLITTDDPAPACSTLFLESTDPQVSALGYQSLFSYLLTAKMANRTVELYTGDSDCKVFRAEIVD